MVKHLLFVFTLLPAAVVIQAPAEAQIYEGARPVSLGTAYSAVASGNEAIYWNPAGMSLYQNRYNIDIGYEYNPTGGGNWFNASIVDCATNPPFGFGLAFTYDWQNTVPNPRTWYKGYRIDIALSYPIAKQKVIWGMNVRWLDYDVNSRNSSIYAVTGDTGILYIINKYVRGSIVGRNLVPIGRPEFPYQSVVGVSAGDETKFNFDADITVSYLTLSDIWVRTAAGLEGFVGQHVGLRAGYYWDQKEASHYVSGGLGFVSTKFGFDLAYKQNLTNLDDRFLYVVIRIFAGG
jgi:hypothetical protein